MGNATANTMAPPPGGSGRKTRIALLAIAAIPAFCGYPLSIPGWQVLPGVPASWCLYGLMVHITVAAVCGPRLYANIVTVAAMIIMPVIFSGAAVSHLARFTGLSRQPGPLASVHYLRLCLTMLTVIPLALGLVTGIPFESAEQKLLQSSRGVGPWQKKLLMALRVFNHICFTVMAGLVETVREEKSGLLQPGSGRLKAFMGLMRHAAIEGICSAVQYIPVWAAEIGSLPGSPPNPKPCSKPADQEEK